MKAAHQRGADKDHPRRHNHQATANPPPARRASERPVQNTSALTNSKTATATSCHACILIPAAATAAPARRDSAARSRLTGQDSPGQPSHVGKMASHGSSNPATDGS